MRKDNYLCGSVIHVVSMKDGKCGVTFMEPMEAFDPMSPRHIFDNEVDACVFIHEELVQRQKVAASDAGADKGVRDGA